MTQIKADKAKFQFWSNTSKFKRILIIFFALVIASSLYLYKCYTDPLYFKSELYENNRFERCRVLSNYIPNGTTRAYVEKILIDSDGARIEPNNPNSNGPEVGAIIYNLDPWVLYSNDAAYVYVWYDHSDKVIGFAGTRCGWGRYPLAKRKYLDAILKAGEGK